MKILKRFLAVFLAVTFIVISLSGCSDNKIDPNDNNKADKEVIDLTGQTELASTVSYANRIANGIQAFYENTEYENGAYVVQNRSATFSHNIKGGNKTVGYFNNSVGNTYLESTMDVYLVNGGERQYAKKSTKDARINTTNLGYYYYTVNVRDFVFDGISCYLEKIYHAYSDKINEQFRIVSSGSMTDVEAAGFEVKVNKSKVSAYEIYDGNGYYSSPDGFNADTVRYVALDIKDAGVIGFIFSDKEYKVTVSETDKYFIIRQEADMDGSALPSGEDFSFGNRIYNDETHSFDGIRAADVIERNPLSEKNFSVTDEDRAEFVGYDALKGCYEFGLAGNNFYDAYFTNPEKKYLAKITVKGDEYDRQIYLYVHTGYPLEGAAVLDGNDVQIPVPVQVSKNFGHEKEEPIYDPSDKIYGDSYLPLAVEKNSTKKLTVVNVYQKWGEYDIKQLSSISYYVSYYHLSTGVHETNCIAPYYAVKGPSLNYGSFGKSWFMPDFRGASGDMWNGDPQFNSAGMLMSVNSDDGNTLCTYLNSDIRSSGLTYADLDYSYVSDDGAFKYTMRHVEMPQNDEARTYYTVSIEFLKDISYEKGSFSLASFNGRNCTYKYSFYLDANGKEVKIENPVSSYDEAKIYELNKNSSYFTLYGINESDTQDQANFGLIVKDYDITVNGSASDVSLGYLCGWRDNLNYASLTFNDDVSFKKGDTVNADVIFLSYGKVGQIHCDNVKKVYEDSVVNAIKISAMTGKVVTDGYIPTIMAENNTATFALAGGVNGEETVNYAVKVTGCTKLAKPKVYEYVNGEWVERVLSSECGYDGYSVSAENGKLTYSFVFTQNSSGKMFRFEV